MRVWTVSFVIFFILSELYQWLEGVTLPLPVFVGAGALLAIASNTSSWRVPSITVRASPAPPPSTSSVPAEPAPTLPPPLANTTGLPEGDTPPLPVVEKRNDNPFLREPSISFTVRPPKSNTPPNS